MEHKNIQLDENLPEYSRQVEKSLADGAQAGLALAAALDKARAAAKALAVTSSKVKRVLSGFDEINRLGQAKTSTSRKKSTAQKTEDLVPPEQTDRPSLEIVDVPPLSASFFKTIGLMDLLELIKQIKGELSDLWQGILQPLTAWAEAVLLPVIGYQLQIAFDALSLAIRHAGEWIGQSWQTLYDGATSIFQGIIGCFTNAKERFAQLMTFLLTGNSQIGGSAEALGQRVGGGIGLLLTAWERMKATWELVGSALKAGMVSTGAVIASVLQGILDFLNTGFTKGWKAAFLSLKEPVFGVINSIIGFLNKMLSGLGSALNSVVNAANRLKFTVPDWVPGIGGKTYGFSLKTVSMPQIPYLAQGAVLPANQPFLAVVGDQKHGTNIEAPLATIQEAVAAVMADHTAGNMAGHEATVAVLRQILEAVLGMDVGETVIARAAQSYRNKYSVMKGGGF